MTWLHWLGAALLFLGSTAAGFALRQELRARGNVETRRVLVFDGIEKETSGSVGLTADEAAIASDPEVSTVRVADLYRLVNSEYQKYLSQRTDAEQFSIDDTDEMRFGADYRL